MGFQPPARNQIESPRRSVVVIVVQRKTLTDSAVAEILIRNLKVDS